MTALPPLVRERIPAGSRVLVAGCGGGFDVYAGLPLYHVLTQAGHVVHLANLSGASLVNTDAEQLVAGGCWEITASTAGVAYLPEQMLAEYLAGQGEPQPVYAFPMLGVRPLVAAQRSLVEHLHADVVITVDGGADSLMRGDEFSLGTPAEEMASLVAWRQIEDITAIHVCIGFGIDAYHDVAHAQALRSIAALTETGAFLGVSSVDRDSDAFRFYREAVRHAIAGSRDKQSIVQSAIVAAVEGGFGSDFEMAGGRGSEVWVNPLLALLWAFDLRAVADRLLFKEALMGTETFAEVVDVIANGRRQLHPRPHESIPI